MTTTMNHRLGPGQAITLNTWKLTGKSPLGISFLLDTFLESIKQEKSDEFWPPPCFVWDAVFFKCTSISFFLSKSCKPSDISFVFLHPFWIEIHIHFLVFFECDQQIQISWIKVKSSSRMCLFFLLLFGWRINKDYSILFYSILSKIFVVEP